MPKHIPPLQKPHILVVDDDLRIGALLKEFLEQNTYQVSVASSAENAYEIMQTRKIDLLVLDVMMPDEDGLSFTKRLRRQERFARMPIIMLTALSDVSERICGLEAGGDDYLTKPFAPRELLLRIENIMRRLSSTMPPGKVRFGTFLFDLETQLLWEGEKRISLTETERHLLTLFALHPNETLSRDTVSPDATSLQGLRKLDVQINRLRKKIEKEPGMPRHLQTVRHIGYRLVITHNDTP